MRVLDLTHTIAENMPVYPGTETPIFAGANTYEKDGFKETKLTMYTHTGTHMDPPAHLFAGRTTLDAFPASQFIGKALVIECSDLNEGKAITLERILQYGIVNIENLKGLDKCGKGLFSFSCFPLKLENCDGSPIRAVAWFED